ncbi:MAG: transglycosylase domain-containing protein, partial [Silvanigrellales bacterium]|nr:transglycosylase domain-containing protein [Silvanigrellales bacterium]
MKKFFIAGIIGVLAAVLAPLSLVGYAGYEVFLGDYDHLKKEKILEILSKETTVYYADGQSQLGSLFGTEHRHYVLLKEIPRHMLDAMVAAEDDGFYKHAGVDFLSTARALFKNITTGRREGASTITQQTVKNLYGRPVTNYRAKFTEALNAFKIERVYSKEEILEFYLNQFHVTGNGRGVGVAAKYYFDKEAMALNLTEAAFIAGSVKGPERYNPFTKRTKEAQAKARTDAKNRKNYVLRRMFESRLLSEDVYKTARDEEVPFKQGRFQFNELFITEIVQRQVGKEEILKAIGAETIDQVGSMGLRMTTTLERPVQIAAQYGVRQNLSRLEMILGGFQKENPANFVYIQKPEKFGFYVARVASVSREKKKESATLSFGVSQCEVPTEGIDRVAKITDQAWYRGVEKAKALFLEQLQEGDTVLASIKEASPDGELVCDIERRPRIQGALIVLDKGRIVSMVGGYSPNEYNRAVFARRQPGSTFKTLTFYPALQLGWNALEPLVNSRSVYTWQGQFYYPRPDHAPVSLETSFIGAGAGSENLASVYLLARLLDKLTFSQFRELLEALDVYNERMTDAELSRVLAGKFNVKFNEWNLKGGLFESLRSDLSQDLSIASDPRLRAILRSMSYGHGFEAEVARLNSRRGAGIPAKERALRIQVLRNNFLRWSRVAANARVALARLRTLVEQGDLMTGADRGLLASFRLAEGGKKLAWMSPDAFRPSAVSPLLADPVVEEATPDRILAAADSERALLADENLLLDGVFPASLESEIAAQVNSRFEQVQAAPMVERLFVHDDFRYSLGMIYAQQMTRQMGVESEIQWVPSYPLGANVVTLAELALSYQTILDGNTHRYFSTGADNQLLIIERIEDSQGNLLWEAQAKKNRLFDPFYTPSMMSILRGTVTNGTARAAHKNVILRSNVKEEDDVLLKAGIRVPIFGKTGTTNDYVNATYVGFLPYPAAEGARSLSAENAYTIAAYVGYDTNEPMRKRGFKVAGGTGALPAWIETALALVKEEKFAEKLDWKGLVEKKSPEVPFDYGDDAMRIAVPVHSSLVQLAGASSNAAPEDLEAKTDLNATIDDYARKGSEPLFLGALPGSEA